MPASEITATSVVPPPMSTIMLPVGSVIGSPAPIAAAIACSIRYTSVAPARRAESRTARFSTCVISDGTEMTMEIKGRDLVEGVPKTLIVSDEEIREALSETVATIVEAVRVALERTPPELSADIMDKGIIIAGGGSMLKNLDKRLREETGLPVTLAEDPLACVALGTGLMLTDFNLLRKISIE